MCAKYAPKRSCSGLSTILVCIVLLAVSLRLPAQGQVTAQDIPRLIEEMRNTNDLSRSQHAAYLLATMYDPKAVATLIRLLKDKDEPVRSAVVSALGALKAPRAVDPLLTCLKEKGKPMDSSIGIITDSFASTRQIIPATLGILRNPKAIKPLVKECSSNPIAAINSLCQLKDRRAVPALIEALGNNRLRELAQIALSTISGKSYTTPAEWQTWWLEQRQK